MGVVLEVRDMVVRRGGEVVLEIPHLEVMESETLAVIGPNGAGKSTLLLALSQLLKPERGQLLFKGRLLSFKDTLAYRRSIGMVLQDALLLDTSVYENVASGLRFRGFPAGKIEQRVSYWLERLGIGALRDRRARQLSGGEAQRVSLARALALHPDILFLDEPFSALDAPTRMRLMLDFKDLLAGEDLTTIFITHDRDEALLLGDRVAVILETRIRQIGRPEEVFTAPADPEIARFVGVETVIPGQVLSVEEGLATVRANGFTLEAVGEVRPGQPVLLFLRPEDVTLSASGFSQVTSARNRLPGTIAGMTPHGPLERVVVDCGFPLVSLVTRASAREMGLRPGMAVVASFKASAVHLVGR
jgi:tungstate transport system ATP-binding protein